MTLVDAFYSIFGIFRSCFVQARTFERARRLACAHLLNPGRQTISQLVRMSLECGKDWSADYAFFSKRLWDPKKLFGAFFKEALRYSQWPHDLVVCVLDDTIRKKSGLHIPAVRTLRDTASLPFHVNLTRAIRFIQFTLLVRPAGLYEAVRGIPVWFQEASPAKKPGRRASEKTHQAYKKEQMERRLGVLARQGVDLLLKWLKEIPGKESSRLLIVADGGYCNRTFLGDLPEEVLVVARTRKDLRLYSPVTDPNAHGRPRIYGERLPTPEEMRRSEEIPWRTARIFGAGAWHDVRLKVVGPVLWKTGTGARPWYLIIVAPLRYRKTKHGKLLYRQPAYLLCSYVEDVPVEVFLQAYFFRPEIELNNRDEKTLMGLGEAQVRSERSVRFEPAFTVLIYAVMLLASLVAYGPWRTDDYLKPPRWRKKDKRRRPSTMDILMLMRYEALKEREKYVLSLEQQLQAPDRKKPRGKRPRSLVEPRKRGFVSDPKSKLKPPKVPINPLTSYLYAVF